MTNYLQIFRDYEYNLAVFLLTYPIQKESLPQLSKSSALELRLQNSGYSRIR